MDRFINKIDLAPLCVDKDACIQFLYDEGLLRTRMLCPECYAPFLPVPRRAVCYAPFLPVPRRSCYTNNSAAVEDTTELLKL